MKIERVGYIICLSLILSGFLLAYIDQNESIYEGKLTVDSDDYEYITFKTNTSNQMVKFMFTTDASGHSLEIAVYDTTNLNRYKSGLYFIWELDNYLYKVLDEKNTIKLNLEYSGNYHLLFENDFSFIDVEVETNIILQFLYPNRIFVGMSIVGVGCLGIVLVFTVSYWKSSHDDKQKVKDRITKLTNLLINPFRNNNIHRGSNLAILGTIPMFALGLSMAITIPVADNPFLNIILVPLCIGGWGGFLTTLIMVFVLRKKRKKGIVSGSNSQY